MRGKRRKWKEKYIVETAWRVLIFMITEKRNGPLPENQHINKKNDIEQLRYVPICQNKPNDSFHQVFFLF